MPKVLHINTYDRAGGAEEFALYMAIINDDHLLVKKKMTDSHHVSEFGSNFSDRMFLFLDKILWKFGEKRKLKQLLSWSDRFNSTYRKLKKNKFYRDADIVHLHNIHGGYFDLKSLLKIANEKKIVWTVHDRWPLTGGEAYLNNKNHYATGEISPDTLMLYALNRPIVDARLRHIAKKKNIFKAIDKNMRFVAPGLYVHEVLSGGYTIPKEANINSIYYGIDCENFTNDNERSWSIPRVLMLNSNSPFKNTKHIFDELKKFSTEIELHTFGSRVEEDLSEMKKIKHIDHGYISDRNEIQKLYNQVDIFVFSTNNENFPLVSVEAAASGLLVLGSAIGPLIEQSEMFDMRLFRNDIKGDLAEKLKELCGDLSRTRSLGANASKFVHEKLRRQDSMIKYNALYEDALAN
ncbi:MAG: glycosyltransferase involved in cell wall biosynthesis [Ulvibacter sp.]|jgi:glycosyltransferase involved in cell wall biosynthesis